MCASVNISSAFARYCFTNDPQLKIVELTLNFIFRKPPISHKSTTSDNISDFKLVIKSSIFFKNSKSFIPIVSLTSLKKPFPINSTWEVSTHSILNLFFKRKPNLSKTFLKPVTSLYFSVISLVKHSLTSSALNVGAFLEKKLSFTELQNLLNLSSISSIVNSGFSSFFFLSSSSIAFFLAHS